MIIGEIFAANLGGAATMTGDPPNIILGTSLGLGFWDFLQNNGPICLVGFGVALGYFYLCFRNKLRAGAWSVDPALWAMEPGDAIPNRRAFGVNVAIFGGMILLLATHAWTGLTMPTIGVVAAAVTLAGNRRGGACCGRWTGGPSGSSSAFSWWSAGWSRPASWTAWPAS